NQSDLLQSSAPSIALQKYDARLGVAAGSALSQLARAPARRRRRDVPLDPEECFGTDRHRVDPCLDQEARKRRVIGWGLPAGPHLASPAVRGFDEGDESAMKIVD